MKPAARLSFTDLLILSRARLRSRSVLVQELLALVGVAIGVGLLFASQIASTSLAQSASQLSKEVIGSGPSFQLQARGTGSLPETLVSELSRLPGVDQALPVLETQASLIGPRGRQSIDLIGTDPRLAHAGSPLLRRFTAAQLGSQHAIALPVPLAKALGVGSLQVAKLQVGSRVQSALVAATLGSGDIGELVNSPVALTNVPYAQSLTGLDGRISRVFVRAHSGRTAEVRRELADVAAQVGADLAPGTYDAELFAVASAPARLAERLFSAISALVAFLFALNAMLVIAPGRRLLIKEVLRPQGATPGMIAQLLLFDAGVLALLGCALGLLVGNELSVTVFRSSPDYLSFAFPVGNDRIVTLQSAALAIAAGVAATVAGALWPFRDLFSRGGQKNATASRRSRPSPRVRRTITGIFFLSVTTMLLAFAPKAAVPASAALLVALLFLVPVLFDVCVALFDRFQDRFLNGASSVLAVVELRSPGNRVRSLAIVATAAIAIFGVVQFQVAQANLQHGLDDSARDIDANADVWITAAGAANTFATTPFKVELASFAHIKGIASIGLYRGSFLNWGRRRLWIVAPPASSMGPMPPSQLRSGHLGLTTARLRQGGWAVVSEALASERHLHLGSRFTVPSPRPIVLRVAGLSTNLAWPSGAILMNSSDYARGWGQSEASAYLVQARAGVAPAAVREQIIRALGPDTGLVVETRAERERRHFASSRAGLSRLTQIRILLLIAAVLAVAGAIGAMIWQRREMVATIRGEGYKKSVIWRWLCCESALLVGTGSTIGAAFGVYGQIIASDYLASVTGFPVVYSSGVLIALASLVLLSLVTVALLAIPGYLVARRAARAPTLAY
jgi:putative ABC transport system permease protein